MPSKSIYVPVRTKRKPSAVMTQKVAQTAVAAVCGLCSDLEEPCAEPEIHAAPAGLVMRISLPFPHRSAHCRIWHGKSFPRDNMFAGLPDSGSGGIH